MSASRQPPRYPQAGPSNARSFHANGHSQALGPAPSQPSHHGSQLQQQFQHPSSLPQTVQLLIQLGAERNMQASQMQGLTGSNRKNAAFTTPTLAKLDKETELCWVQAGRLAETLGDWARALSSYEAALRHSPFNIEALTQTANILRQQEKFVEAAEYFTRVIHLNEEAGEVWGALGHCYLMIDDLPKAYACYQQAITHIPDAKNEPKLWYGIGILYDRYGSLEHAEEAFASVIQTDPNFEKSNEIYFRLGIIYKQQKNSADSLQCFKYILHNPPRPLTEIDIWFQIGHVYEQQQEYDLAKDAYDRVLAASPNHAKVLQQLGGLYQRQGASFYDVDRSVLILTKSLEQDANDPFSWYLLGRAYMAGGNYGKAYEAYQQAVYRDGKNPAFWCSIGVLYYQINQFHDALDAYSRAIRINPYISEVWHNLGALYESCNDQMPDALDAYNRSVHLDPLNDIIRRRLDHIEVSRVRGTPLSPPPRPKDISPASDNWQLANGSGASGPPPPPVPSDFGEQATHQPVHRNGSGPGRQPPEGYSHHLGERDAAMFGGSRPGSIGGRASLSTSAPQMDEEHLSRSAPRPMQMPVDLRRPSGANRPIIQSPPLSPRQTLRPDYPPQSEHLSRFPPPEEWERGRPAHGYRDHHAPSFPNPEARNSMHSPSAAISPRPQLSRPASATHTPTNLVSPRDHSPPLPATGQPRKVSKGDKNNGQNGDKKANSRKPRLHAPVLLSGPKLPVSDAGRAPISAALSSASSSSAVGHPSSANEHDKAGMDALLALSGHASEATPIPTPRKRSLNGSDAEGAPNNKKLKSEEVLRQSGTPQPVSPSSAPLPAATPTVTQASLPVVPA